MGESYFSPFPPYYIYKEEKTNEDRAYTCYKILGHGRCCHDRTCDIFVGQTISTRKDNSAQSSIRPLILRRPRP